MSIPDPAEDMPGNPYTDLAYYAADLVPSNREPADDAATAQAYATLAFAYEQRTANLIAKMALNLQLMQAAGVKVESTTEGFNALDDQVLDRLGLEGDS